VAPSAGTLRVGRYFAALFALLVVLYAIVFWPHQPRTPKLGLDLEGGAQVILKADAAGKAPSKAAMNQARQIISDRVNGLGVSSAEVAIQGGDRIVVSVPGKNGDDIKDVGSTALLQFRPLMIQAISAAPAATGSASPSASGTATPSATATAKPTGSASAKPSGATTSASPRGRVVPRALAAPTPTATATATTSTSTNAAATTAATGSATPSATPGASSTPPPATAGPIDQWAGLGFTPPVNAAALKALPQAQQAAIQARIQAWPCSDKIKPIDDITKPLIACSQANTVKYLLAPVIVKGTEIKSAQALAPGSQQGQFTWTISLSLKPGGQAAWADYTSKHNQVSTPDDVANTVAYTLDSKVIEAAQISTTINGDTSITGSFNEQTATNFANSLKYGALPLNFQLLTNSTVSPTLGTDQLKAGLLAGGIGLALVVVYSLMYYRALGLVTIASLLVSGGLTYAMLVILGKQIGFTLTLAGIAGFIVAVGITADSFVVFFERIKDEVHEGRTARTAIPRAWVRSRRTIISADTVSLLAAVILYYFAAGEVRGFAFTLGLSTVLDLIVVFLFTHPLVALFSRSASFGSARFTGLNHVRDAGIAVASPEPAYAGAASATSTESGAGGGAKRAAGRRSTAAAAAPQPTTEPQSRVPVPDFEPPAPAEVPEVGPPVAPGGSAAERAAARRARQRNRDSSGEGDAR
jgi:preprotein translocase subunit SecD